MGRFLSVRQVAEYSSLSTRFIYSLCKDRKLKFYKCGKRIVISVDDLLKFIDDGLVEPVDDWSEKLGIKK